MARHYGDHLSVTNDCLGKVEKSDERSKEVFVRKMLGNIVYDSGWSDLASNMHKFGH